MSDSSYDQVLADVGGDGFDSSVDPSNGATIVSNNAFAALFGADDTPGDTSPAPLAGQQAAANATANNGANGGLLGAAGNVLGGLGNLAGGFANNYVNAQAAAASAQKIAQYALIGGVVIVGLYLLTRKK